MNVDVVWRREDGVRLPASVWRAGDGWRMISSAMVGGGIGPAGWVLNAQVAGGYARLDPVEHLAELASEFGLAGPGVGMLTAAAVDRLVIRADEGVEVVATVGLRVPTWAAAPPGGVDLEFTPIRDEAKAGADGPRPGTINIVVSVPASLGDAALVNAVATVTEAKTQALLDAGYHCSGTATDAVCVAVRTGGPADPFGGPRSRWGARIARAVHAAVREGAVDYTAQLRRLSDG
ncbi:adenosylcobinamide amidohydrolase [Actinomadura sp. HBU206391]|uniref:adenosylcobinamide amidohydrolase n=1 Tax=Actinomadura sp. HBU206391 TaxID=2731692 RepID=UPI002905DF20|nr:adenosylcobinamide amidohydrolase [Actinomadura sp. HBU206391]